MRLLFFFLALSMTSNVWTQTYEKDYSLLISNELGGVQEYAVTSGYVDVLTDEYAIEVEYANKWKQAIGQALWYGLQTNRQPGIVLIKRQTSDNKYTLQLGSALSYGELDGRIRLWVWPDDFKGTSIGGNQQQEQLGAGYWLSNSSGKRHNSGCRFFEKSRGQTCDAHEGVACGICGG